jgi:hypothetical protein
MNHPDVDEIRKIFMLEKARKQKPMCDKQTEAPHATADPTEQGDFTSNGTPHSAEDIIIRMLSSASGAKIKKLFDGDMSEYNDDHSTADLALCAHLAFWTNKNAKLMDEIFRKSKLIRSKWDELRGADTYGNITIAKAIETCTNTINNPTIKSPPAPVPIKPWTLEQLSVARMKGTPPERQFVIPGLLPAGVLGMLSGEGFTTRKSMALLTLLVQCAIASPERPQKWLGQWPLKGLKGLYVSLEDYQDDVWIRIHAIIRSLGNFDDLWPLVEKNLLILSKEDFREGDDFEKLIDEDGHATPKFERFKMTLIEQQPALVIVDTKTKATDNDENTNQLNSRMMDTMDRLTRIDSKPSIVLVAHVSKGVRAGTETHGMNAARGAGALTDDARWAMWFRPVTGTKELVEVIPVKISYGVPSDPIVVEFKWPSFTLTTKTAQTVKDAHIEEQKLEIKNKILEILGKSPTPISITNLRAMVHKGKAIVAGCVLELQIEGHLEKVGGGKTTGYVVKPSSSEDAVE